MDLIPGRVHQASASNGLHCISSYPTPSPGLWQVSVARRGLPKIVSAEDVIAVLDGWDVRPGGEWTHCPGPLRETAQVICWREARLAARGTLEWTADNSISDPSISAARFLLCMSGFTTTYTSRTAPRDGPTSGASVAGSSLSSRRRGRGGRSIERDSRPMCCRKPEAWVGHRSGFLRRAQSVLWKRSVGSRDALRDHHAPRVEH